MAFTPLEIESRPTVQTAAAAYYLNYSEQTLRHWASKGTGPIQPIRIEGSAKLHWRTADIRTLLRVPA